MNRFEIQEFGDSSKTVDGPQYPLYEFTITPGTEYDNLLMESDSAPFLKCIEVTINSERQGDFAFGKTWKNWCPFRLTQQHRFRNVIVYWRKTGEESSDSKFLLIWSPTHELYDSLSRYDPTRTYEEVHLKSCCKNNTYR